MQRAVEMLGGGILGYIVGFFLCAPLIAHVFGPTTVTWDARSCPTGLYTITSTASSQDGLLTFTATSERVELPRDSVLQSFGEIPVGQYRVTAVARDANGRIFQSNTQTVTGEGLPTLAPTPTPAPEPPIVAAPRRNRGHQEPASTSEVPQLSTQAKAASIAAPVAAPVATVRLSAEMLRLLRSENLKSLLGSSPWLRRVVFFDRDEDGQVDAVQVEWVSGELRVATISR